MDPATTRANFPFDVLGIIFDYYVDNETVYSPLETMLLVCRSWNDAALGHRKLWARLKIHLGHYPTSNIWKVRLPRRLERTGDSALLEIDLRVPLDSSDLPPGPPDSFDRHNQQTPHSFGAQDLYSFDIACRTVQELLVMLAGPHGKLCRRWKSLRLHTDNARLGKEMTYPTPNLEFAWLEQFFTESHIPILPSVPKLKTLVIHRPYRLKLPSVENVQTLTIREAAIGPDMDLSNLKTAINVENLTIGTRWGIHPGLPIHYSLPNILPRLSSLSFIGSQLPSNLMNLQAPNIRRLSLKVDDAEILQAVVDSSLPFWTLQELELILPRSRYIDEELKMSMSNLLFSCISVTRIKGDRKSLSVIVKLYWDKGSTKGTGRENIMGQALSFWSNDENREVGVRRRERKPELEDVALCLGLILPSMSWEYILQRL
jgi:hypothetical protein